jgi:hypothetical protein
MCINVHTLNEYNLAHCIFIVVSNRFYFNLLWIFWLHFAVCHCINLCSIIAVLAKSGIVKLSNLSSNCVNVTCSVSHVHIIWRSPVTMPTESFTNKQPAWPPSSDPTTTGGCHGDRISQTVAICLVAFMANNSINSTK